VNFLITLMTVALSLLGESNEPVLTKLEINIEGIEKNKGKILLALYDSEQGFPSGHKQAVKSVEGVPQNGKCSFTITDLKSGKYAFSLFHDLNGDNKLNTNMIGIPKEGYAFSNNATGKFGPPSFRDAAFLLKENTLQQIKMIYW